MLKRCMTLTILAAFCLGAAAAAQTLDGSPYTPGKDPDIDLYIASWKDSMPTNTHGSLVERDILTRGSAMKPPRKGAVLEYVNRFTYATLDAGASTTPTTLRGEQEIFYFVSGKGVVTAGRKTADVYNGICILMPANLEFTIKNTGGEPVKLYLVNEPIPEGFRPNKDMLVRDENTLPIQSTNGHWCHIVKNFFETDAGLGTLERVLTVCFDPMTIGHPHSHTEGCEEVWTAVSGTSLAFLGKQIREQPPGTAYMIPPDGNTPHANINTSDEQIKLFYFARYRDHEVRK
ncbi:MAG: cupin domain-containing protein [Candidatus Latescibacteria bacterium]|nr:cupin domain-containing protein [Candidatus Latescibacterota bacterium]